MLMILLISIDHKHMISNMKRYSLLLLLILFSGNLFAQRDYLTEKTFPAYSNTCQISLVLFVTFLKNSPI